MKSPRHIGTLLLCTAALIGAGCGADGSDIPLHECTDGLWYSSDWGGNDLVLEHQSPLLCPLPYVTQGEALGFGGIIRDGGSQDFRFAWARVRNPANELKGESLDPFNEEGGEWVAHALTVYTARTLGNYDTAYYQVERRLLAGGPEARMNITYQADCPTCF